jgi:hypothetical protein
MMPMLLVFGGFLAKYSANALTELQFHSGLGRVEIGEPFSTEVFHLREKFLKVPDATSELLYRGSLRTRAGLIKCFCSCHGIWEILAHSSQHGKKTWESAQALWKPV